MQYTSESIERAVEAFSSLPSIGRKTAQRLTYFMLRQNESYIKNFSAAMTNLHANVKLCSVCFNYTEIDPCPICASQKRDAKVICVVEEPNDVVAIEKTNEFFGHYHVLHGILNPMEGITPNELKIKELLARLMDVTEVIIAINPSIEGEVTTQYLAKLMKPLDIKVTRIASGVPIGSSLEFTDEATLTRALEGRVTL